jgi:hypothetical protein
VRVASAAGGVAKLSYGYAIITFACPGLYHYGPSGVPIKNPYGSVAIHRERIDLATRSERLRSRGTAGANSGMIPAIPVNPELI